MPDQSDHVWDLFISHASEDKETFVRPLAHALQRFGLNVWYDESALNIGDSLSRSIDAGLSRSNYGLVVLSPAFIAKKWPEYELRGLIAREMSGAKVILPVWHNLEYEELVRFSPPLADKFAIRSDDHSLIVVAARIIQVVKPDLLTRIMRRIAHLEFVDTAPVHQIPIAEIKLGGGHHHALPDELIGRIRLVRAALLEVYPHSMSFWVEGFSADAHPSNEVAHWERVAAVHLEYLEANGPLSGEEKQAVFNYVSSIWSGSPQTSPNLPDGAANDLLEAYREKEPLRPVDEVNPFLDEAITTSKDERPDETHDREHFPNDLPEDLIRELMQSGVVRPRRT